MSEEEFKKRVESANIDKLLKEQIRIKKDMFLLERTLSIKVDYDFDEKNGFLGEGGFGRVYKARDRETNELRAIKHLYRSEINDPEQFFAEVNNLKAMDHPNIVKLIEIYEEGDNIWLV